MSLEAPHQRALATDRAPVVRGQLGAWVATELARAIAQWGLRPGDPLPAEAELATRYGVSVRVIRDALRVLGSQGVIQTSQGRRAVVADRPSAAIEGYFTFATAVDQAAVQELFEVRIALETRAAGLAATNASEEDRAAVAEMLARMRATVEDIEAYADADLAWHAAVVAAAHNRFLSGIHTALAQVLRRERITGATMRFRAGGSAARTLDDHAAVSDAILRRDRRSAERAMLEHLSRAQSLYAEYLAGMER